MWLLSTMFVSVCMFYAKVDESNHFRFTHGALLYIASVLDLLMAYICILRESFCLTGMLESLK